MTNNMDKITPEAQERIRAEVQEMRERILRGEPTPKAERITKPKQPTKRDPSKKRGWNFEGQPRPPKFNYREIADLYEQGMLIKDIAAQVGCGQTTVTTALKKMKPKGYTGKGGRKRLDVCQRGHDMNKYGVEQPSGRGGGRMCAECKRLRQRVGWKAGQ